MGKVRDLRDFYKTATKKSNGKSDDKAPPFLSSASGSVNQAEISIISNEIKSYVQRRKNCNTSVPSRFHSNSRKAYSLQMFKYLQVLLSWKQCMQNGFRIYTIIYVVKKRLFLMASKLLALQRQLNRLVQC